MNTQSHQTFVKWHNKPIFDAWFPKYVSWCWKMSHRLYIRLRSLHIGEFPPSFVMLISPWTSFAPLPPSLIWWPLVWKGKAVYILYHVKTTQSSQIGCGIQSYKIITDTLPSSQAVDCLKLTIFIIIGIKHCWIQSRILNRHMSENRHKRAVTYIAACWIVAGIVGLPILFGLNHPSDADR